MYVRFSKRFPFGHGDRQPELGAEPQNVLQDTANITIVAQNFFAATFAQPNTWLEPRRLQLMAKVRF